VSISITFSRGVVFNHLLNLHRKTEIRMLPGIEFGFTTIGPGFQITSDMRHNKSPEPTPIARRSSAIAVRSLDAAWLSFIR
jgi:hypothetical protein